jgi:hypothetical protein
MPRETIAWIGHHFPPQARLEGFEEAGLTVVFLHSKESVHAAFVLAESTYFNL